MSTLNFIDAHHDRQWHTVGGEDGPAPHPLPREGQLLSLEQWHAVREHWPAGLRTALVLPNTADVESLSEDLSRLSMVLLQFPKWTDGRAYTQAQLLRRRLGYGGEVRATGDVLVDMVPLLKRCGFDAVALRSDQDLEDARRALSFFDEHYQADAIQWAPRFARRTVAAEGHSDRAEAGAGS